MASELSNQKKAWSVLIVSTLAFTVCFMVWMMFAVVGLPLKKTLGLNATEVGLLMAITLRAIWLMAYATAYGHFLTIGLVLGLAGGSFSVGTPYVARWFPKNRQGMAMGVFCAGNSGAAVNKFVAPAILVAFGWTMVPMVYAVIMLITLIRVRRLCGALAVDGAVLRG